MELDPLQIITYFYPQDTPLRRLLTAHSEQVRDKALQILAHSGRKLDAQLLACGAMLHDIGIGQCSAPAIFCTGERPYIAHGIIGGEMLRSYAEKYGMELESCARICERHTGSGLTREDVRMQHLPLPEQDYLPETPEEKLICLADKFFSKSGSRREKTLENIRRSMGKFGPDSLNRFDALCAFFHLSD